MRIAVGRSSNHGFEGFQTTQHHLLATVSGVGCLGVFDISELRARQSRLTRAQEKLRCGRQRATGNEARWSVLLWMQRSWTHQRSRAEVRASARGSTSRRARVACERQVCRTYEEITHNGCSCVRFPCICFGGPTLSNTSWPRHISIRDDAIVGNQRLSTDQHGITVLCSAVGQNDVEESRIVVLTGVICEPHGSSNAISPQLFTPSNTVLPSCVTFTFSRSGPVSGAVVASGDRVACVAPLVG